MDMATALLKSGEIIELPFDQMVDFVVRNCDLIQEQPIEKPLPPRRSKQQPVETSQTNQ